jgi:hypothetical protein
VKIQAVLDKRSVSDITEELYREYLDRRKKEGKGKSKFLNEAGLPTSMNKKLGVADEAKIESQARQTGRIE